jgi:hypothetical protein
MFIRGGFVSFVGGTKHVDLAILRYFFIKYDISFIVIEGRQLNNFWRYYVITPFVLRYYVFWLALLRLYSRYNAFTFLNFILFDTIRLS